MNTLKTLSMRTKNPADHFALKPTATMMHATRPTTETNTREMLHCPRRMKPTNRKMSRMRPASKKLGKCGHVPGDTDVITWGSTHYFLRSFSDSVGRPAKIFLRVYRESVKTMRRPPMTLRLRRKKLRSKMSP